MDYSSDEKILAGIAHLGILFSWYGILVALVIFLFQKDRSEYVASHAKQALGYQVGLLLLSFVFSFIFFGGGVVGFMSGRVGPLFGAAGLWGLLMILATLYGITASVTAFLGRPFRYVLIGDFIDRI